MDTNCQNGDHCNASGTIFDIQRYSTDDGPGIRTTVFLKGCPLNCPWCHNPEGRTFEPVLTFGAARCIGCGRCRALCDLLRDQGSPFPEGCRSCFACAGACPTGARVISGRTATVGEVMAELKRDRIFYDQSKGGVTFSGGEPLARPDYLDALLSECRRVGIHTAIDTCGHAEPAILMALCGKADLVLYDLKVGNNDTHRANTGVGSDLILENLDALLETHKTIWLRLPIVPGHTDDRDEMERLATRYSGRASIGRVVMLPYHSGGEAKLKRMGRPTKMPGATAPTAEAMEALAEIWRRSGFEVAFRKPRK